MKPNVVPALDEIDAAYEQGKTAVRALFERQTGLIRVLEAKIQALEDKIAKNSQEQQQATLKRWPEKADTKESTTV